MDADSNSKRKKCLKLVCWELHISRFSLSHHNWKAFGYTPWLPQKSSFQWVYLIYRWFLAIFFLIHFLYLLSGNNYFFIYLTSWGFITLTVYLLWSALSVTIRYMQHQSFRWCKHVHSKQQRKTSNEKVELPDKPMGYCCPHNALQWFEFIHWILFALASESALAITILYWALFGGVASISYLNIFTHLINSIVILIDMWITRLPVRIYHMVYCILFGAAYTLFTGLYYAGGGRTAFNTTFIYPVLDYDENPGLAVGMGFISSFLLAPLIHLFFYGNYLLREGLLYLVKHKCCKWLNDEKSSLVQQEEKEMNST